MRIRDMTHEYWLYFEKNYVKKDLENEKNRLRNDGKTSNDGDVYEKTYFKVIKSEIHSNFFVTRDILGEGVDMVLLEIFFTLIWLLFAGKLMFSG